MALQGYGKVLVPVDGSEYALRAVEHAGSIALAAGLGVVLLHVSPMGPLEMMQVMGYPAGAQKLADASASEFEKLRGEQAEKVIRAARERLPAGLVVQTIIESGSPAEAILNHADGLGDAIIVMGNRGLSGLRELVIGSVSSKVLHHARCPVTIVR